MKDGVLPGLGGLMLAGAVWAQDMPAGDPATGRQIAGQCRTCHGLDGFARIPIAPHIGGEPAAYLAAQLTAFREGGREHEMMTLVAQLLSDQDIADLSAFYASHSARAEVSGNMPEGLDACTSCHGVDGIAVVDDAPNLAGESSIYLVTQLKAFKSGARQHAVMGPIAATLDEAEMRTLSEWFEGARLEITAAE